MGVEAAEFSPALARAEVGVSPYSREAEARVSPVLGKPAEIPAGPPQGSCESSGERAAELRKANYALAVKENQPTLYNDVKEYFEGLKTGKLR
jgi:hypothetical protein